MSQGIFELWIIDLINDNDKKLYFLYRLVKLLLILSTKTHMFSMEFQLINKYFSISFFQRIIYNKTTHFVKIFQYQTQRRQLDPIFILLEKSVYRNDQVKNPNTNARKKMEIN